MKATTINVQIRPCVSTEDAVVCAKLLEIWLNGDGRRRVEIGVKENGESEISVIDGAPEVPAEVDWSKVNIADPTTFPW